MKAGGFGGFEIQPVYPMELDDPARGIRNVPYLSPEFLDAVSFANRKARANRPACRHDAGQRLALRRAACAGHGSGRHACAWPRPTAGRRRQSSRCRPS